MRSIARQIMSGSGDIKEAQGVLATFPARTIFLVDSTFGDRPDHYR